MISFFFPGKKVFWEGKLDESSDSSLIIRHVHEILRSISFHIRSLIHFA